jgi:hypothetical protein
MFNISNPRLLRVLDGKIERILTLYENESHLPVDDYWRTRMA